MNQIVNKIIENAIAEDLPTFDVTSEWLFSGDDYATAKLLAKEAGILCGIHVFKTVFKYLDSSVEVMVLKEDGAVVNPGDCIATVTGLTKSILMAERTALNLLQRMSGIATETSRYVAATAGTSATIVDTRKTAPGLRVLDKMAVKVGGGNNHRFNLSDGVLIKDNHIAAAGGIKAAVDSVRKHIPHTLKIEVEVDSIRGLVEAIESGADIVMLDNMSIDDMIEAVDVNAGRTILEASGNMTLDRIQAVAKTGVQLISVGALTHSVKALDFSLKF